MPSADRKPRTLYDKVLQDHIVDERNDGTLLLYIGAIAFVNCNFCDALTLRIDRHLVHEVTSPVSTVSSCRHGED